MRVTWALWMIAGCGSGKSEPAQDSVGAHDGSTEAVSDTASPDEEAITDYRSAKWCAECHPTQYAEWEQSMHRYAAHSPVFDAMAAKAFQDTAGATGTFCTGCHTPLGTMDGEPGTTVAADRSEISLEGVTCVVCHQAVAYDVPIGNTSITIDLDAPIQGVFGSSNVKGHQSMKSEVLDTPELCGSCHDVFNFPGLRIEEAYTEYTESPAAAAGIRCQDCHMGPTPGVPSERPVGAAAHTPGAENPERSLASHRFIGPDYSMIDTFPYEDDPAASAAAQAEMRTQTETLLKNAVHIADVQLDETESLSELRITVESLTTGHHVPTGFTSERQLWLSVDVLNGGEVVWQTGDLDTYGDLRDELSWEVMAGTVLLDEQLVNFQSKNLVRAGIETLERGELDVLDTVFPFDATYISRNSLRPLEARQLVYSLPALPAEAEVRVRLRYRNLPPYILRALHLDELIERLQIVDIDEVYLGATR